MASPPQSAEPSELWVALASAKRPTKVVDFPRKDPTTGQPIGQLRMRPLTQGEIIQAKASATEHVQKVLKEKRTLDDVGVAQIFEDACASEIIYRAAVRTDKDELAAFPSAGEVRMKFTTDEMACLVNSYAVVQHELGPITAYMSKEDMDAWLDRLAEGGSALPLASWSSELLRDLVMHSASRLRKSRTDSFSVGGQQDEPT